MMPTLSDPHDLGFDPARLARIDAHLKTKYIDGGRFPHAALLIGRGDEIYSRTRIRIFEFLRL